MEELLYDIHNNGEEAQNTHIFFDDNAWDKVETLLDEEEKNRGF